MQNEIINILKKEEKFSDTTIEEIREVEINDLRCLKMINQHRATHSIGTLGGGNHFIEIDKDDEGKLYVVIHSGSRYLGKEVAEYYQEEAYNQLNNCSKKMLDDVIADLKARGKLPELQYIIYYIKKDFVHIDCGKTRNIFFEVRP